MCCYISGSLHLDGALVDVETPDTQVVLLLLTPKQLLEKSWTAYIDHGMSLVHFDAEVIRRFSIQINVQIWVLVVCWSSEHALISTDSVAVCTSWRILSVRFQVWA
jgi:hypothetical protein